jgi:hypothetical protein
MDLTPDLLAGAAVGARVRPRWAALLIAAGAHLVLDATPHLDIAWIGGHPAYRMADLGIGAAAVLAVAVYLRHPWVCACALFAVLPDAKTLKPWEERFPHGYWGPPWGIAVEVAVAVLGFVVAVTAARRPQPRECRAVPPGGTIRA